METVTIDVGAHHRVSFHPHVVGVDRYGVEITSTHGTLYSQHPSIDSASVYIKANLGLVLVGLVELEEEELSTSSWVPSSNTN